jgi:SAM-dependent methyltransferase
MPTKTWDTKTDFDDAYIIRLNRDVGLQSGDPREYGHYERRALFNAAKPLYDYVSILIVGCGFGWALEFLDAQGFTDIWGADPSTYIQTTKDLTDPNDGKKFAMLASKIQNTNMAVRAQVNALLRTADHDKDGGFDVVISERMLSSLSDQEAVDYSAKIRTWDIVKSTGTVLHIEHDLNPDSGRDPEMNWHKIADWKVLLPNDLIARSGGGEVI